MEFLSKFLRSHFYLSLILFCAFFILPFNLNYWLINELLANKSLKIDDANRCSSTIIDDDNIVLVHKVKTVLYECVRIINVI